MSQLRFDRSMSDAEGLMWRLETDPFLSSTFGSVSILDRAPDLDAFRRRLERASIVIPRLRQRVMTTPGNLTPPVWVDDPDFDLALHLRRISCPKPGTLREVLDLAALFVAEPLDRTRPLWQFLIVEGMRGGKAAIVQKMHHTITDGERGVELSLQYLDFERDAPEPPPPEPPEQVHGDALDRVEIARELVTSGLRIPLGVVEQVRALLADPSGIPDATSSAARTFRGIVDQLGDNEAARSPLWTRRSLLRRIEPARAPFRETKEAAARLGGTLNTAFLTAAAHAASAYHVELGAPTESLRASMAISTRTAESGANAFSLARLTVPTGEMPIADRFSAVNEAARTAREADRSAGLDTLSALAGALPTPLLAKLARQQAETVDFGTSNVKGSPAPCYIAGARLLELYPVGPLLGVAFNLTLISYDGSLDMAINTDAAAVREPGVLATHLRRSFRELATA